MILNVSRLVDGDLSNYVSVQDYISQQSFWTLFEKEQLRMISGTYRVTEIGYYAPMWLLSMVVPDSKTAVALAATLVIYIPTFLALDLIRKTEKWGNGMFLLVASFTFFAGINFVQTTHLIRQYMSSALLFWAFALFLSKRNRWGLVVAFFACTIHNGSALLIPSVASTCWMFRYREGRKLRFIGFTIRMVCILAFLVATMVAVPILQSEVIQENVPNIHVGHFLAVGALFLIAHITIEAQQLRLKSLYYARLAFLAIYIVSLGFFILEFRLFALRYFAYLEWLYGLMLGAILFNLFRDRPALKTFTRFAVALAAAAILTVRVGVSEWTYGPGDNYLLEWDYFEVAQLVSR
jgi:hypothetical protein